MQIVGHPILEYAYVWMALVQPVEMYKARRLLRHRRNILYHVEHPFDSVKGPSTPKLAKRFATCSIILEIQLGCPTICINNSYSTLLKIYGHLPSKNMAVSSYPKLK